MTYKFATKNQAAKKTLESRSQRHKQCFKTSLVQSRKSQEPDSYLFFKQIVYIYMLKK